MSELMFAIVLFIIAFGVVAHYAIKGDLYDLNNDAEFDASCARGDKYHVLASLLAEEGDQ